MQQVCCISIDVDGLGCYYKIHSLGRPPVDSRCKIMCAALPRYAAFFDKHKIKATFFVVAQDIDVKVMGEDAVAMRVALREVRDAGHEIASHSYSHPYELARFDAQSTQQELQRAHEVLSEFVGQPIRGFRAPGYDISAQMLHELSRLEYAYDSSVFPAPGYYLAKALVMGALQLQGHKSGAVVTNARALAAPIRAYRPALHAPWRRGDASVLELPIAVTARTRTPVIATNLLLAPRWLRKHWLGSMATREFFNFEMHGIDLCDAAEDQMPPALVARQPDLRVDIESKLANFDAIVQRIAATGARFATLSEYAAGVASSL